MEIWHALGEGLSLLLEPHRMMLLWGGVLCGLALGILHAEDSTAETDANFVMTGAGGLVEVQATAEAAIFTDAQLAEMMGLARAGIAKLVDLQKSAIA